MGRGSIVVAKAFELRDLFSIYSCTRTNIPSLNQLSRPKQNPAPEKSRPPPQLPPPRLQSGRRTHFSKAGQRILGSVSRFVKSRSVAGGSVQRSRLGQDIRPKT